MKAVALELSVDLLVLGFIALITAGSIVHLLGKAHACESPYNVAQAAQK